MNSRFLKELNLIKFTVFIPVIKIVDKYPGITRESNVRFVYELNIVGIC